MSQQQWIVRMKCVVIKDVVVGPCTEEQARIDPWEHEIEDHEIEQLDWEVTSVTPDPA